MAARTRRTPGPDLDPDDDQDIDSGEQDGYLMDNRSKGSKAPIIIIIVVVLLIGGIAALLITNVGNIRDQRVLPLLRAIPFVGNIIPDGDVQYEYVYVDGELVAVRVEPDETVPAEEIGDIVALREELEAAQAALAQAQALNSQYEETVRTLQTYRDFITLYRERQQRFDEMIALGDPDAFAAFYEEVEPDNAARLFQQIRAVREVDREFRRYARTYTEMNTDEAAAVFTLLLTQNPGLLIRILETFNTDQRAEVFNEMEAQYVAIITIMMEPHTAPADILPPIPLIDGAAEPIPVVTATLADALEEEELADPEEDAEV